MKLNLGCGFRQKSGYLNVDKESACEPDLVVDLEGPWPWEDNSADEIRFWHSLEHMGADRDTFFHIIKETYRVARDGAEIHIGFPHHRHDDFYDDPTHVRLLTATQFFLFSKSECEEWRKNGDGNTLLALYLGVDFETVGHGVVIDGPWFEALEAGRTTEDKIMEAAKTTFNVLKEVHVTLKAIKS